MKIDLVVMYKHVRTNCIVKTITYREKRHIAQQERRMESHALLFLRKFSLPEKRDAVLGLSEDVHACLELVVRMRCLKCQCLPRDDNRRNYCCMCVHLESECM